jgi:D-3-phosphoglycerate dehydrogenase
MTQYRILVSCPLIHDSIEAYDDLFAEHGVSYDVPDVDQQLDEPELLEVIDRYHGVIAGDDEFTARVFEAADRLQVVSKWGIGTDNIDHAAAEDHGVAVRNTPGAFDDEVADVVVGYAIMLTRKLHHIDRAVRDGKWYAPRGVSLSSRTLGVVGVGDIGSTVARRGHALGMDVLGNDVRDLPTDLREDTGIEPRDRRELFDESDVVSLNCALTPETRGMVGREELDRLGPEGYLINASRGEVVDEDALIDALEEGTIAGAALDVFETEPLPTDHPFTDMENVILGSHNAQNTQEAVDRVNDRAVENLLAELD